MQTSYPVKQTAALAGQLADLGPNYIRSAANGSGQQLSAGLAVTRGDSDDVVTLPASATDPIVGVTVHTHTQDRLHLADGKVFGEGDTMNVLDRGAVFVAPEEAVTPADPVYARIANGSADPSLTQKGAFRASDDAGTAVLVRGARWLTSANAGEPAMLAFDAGVQAAVPGSQGAPQADVADVAAVAAQDAAGETPTAAEFAAVVALANETKQQLNAALAALRAYGVIEAGE